MKIFARIFTSAAIIASFVITLHRAAAENEPPLTEADMKAMQQEACANKDVKNKFLEFIEKSRGKEERGIVSFELDEECDLLRQNSPATPVNDTADTSPGASHTDSVLDAHFSPDGKTILSASKDGTLRLWDVETGKPISRIELPQTKVDSTGDKLGPAYIQSAVFLGDGKYVAAAAHELPVLMFEATTGKKMAELKTKTKYNLAAHLAASPSGFLMVSQNDGRSVAGFPITHQMAKYEPPSATASAISESAGLLAVASDKTVVIVKLDSGDLVKELKRDERDRVELMAFSNDGSRLAVGYGRNVVVFDVKSGEVLQTVQVHPLFMAFDAAFTADGKGLITCRSHPVLWDIATGKIVRRYGPFHDLCHSIDVSPDGKTMVTTSLGSDVRIWDIETGKFIRRFGTNLNSKH